MDVLLQLFSRHIIIIILFLYCPLECCHREKVEDRKRPKKKKSEKKIEMEKKTRQEKKGRKREGEGG
jgi:hypothetical protein